MVKHYVFRVDGSTQIGSGHVMRCLVLAQALREKGGTVTFISRVQPGDMCALIERRGFPVLRLGGIAPPEPGASAVSWQDDAAQTVASLAALGTSPNWLVVDHYLLDRRWETVLAGAVERILVIDDLADRPHCCQLLLDQNLVADLEGRYADKLPAHCAALLGPHHALLDPAYALLRAGLPVKHGPVRRILAFFGGVDAADLSGRTMRAFAGLGRQDVVLDVVTTSANPHLGRLREQASGQPCVRLHQDLPTLAHLMAAADLAIGAGGISNWERLCLGLPALVVTVADNQRAIAQELDRLGLIRWLGDEDAVDEGAISRAVCDILHTGLEESWSRACREVVDGWGAGRVAAILAADVRTPLTVRAAMASDELLLLGWANDPVTRANGFHPEAIVAATHHDWLGRKLADPLGCRFYIVETPEAVPVGQVRFERQGAADWEIHFSLGTHFRGRGLGATMVAVALSALHAQFDHATIIGRVLERNRASHRIFEHLGFSAQAGEGGFVAYRRDMREHPDTVQGASTCS